MSDTTRVRHQDTHNPRSVWALLFQNELTKIQRMSMWACCSNHHETFWVSWKHVCQPKNKGGSGLKDLELFNISLLKKWKWLIDKNALWYDLLKFKYG